mmetsp:Transcript_67333/g.179708  ORF Transcript_67333/g.179708 Transcript_67333/m.179708 type:complete len:350 (-) Transcript_67333:1952-3001(-)
MLSSWSSKHDTSADDAALHSLALRGFSFSPCFRFAFFDTARISFRLFMASASSSTPSLPTASATASATAAATASPTPAPRRNRFAEKPSVANEALLGGDLRFSGAFFTRGVTAWQRVRASPSPSSSPSDDSGDESLPDMTSSDEQLSFPETHFTLSSSSSEVSCPDDAHAFFESPRLFFSLFSALFFSFRGILMSSADFLFAADFPPAAGFPPAADFSPTAAGFSPTAAGSSPTAARASGAGFALFAFAFAAPLPPPPSASSLSLHESIVNRLRGVASRAPLLFTIIRFMIFFTAGQSSSSSGLNQSGGILYLLPNDASGTPTHSPLPSSRAIPSRNDDGSSTRSCSIS